MYDKDNLKNKLTINQISQLLAELGGEPTIEKNGSILIAQTICHNHPGEGSHKLYYYDNTKLFKCYTDCSSTFDIFELIIKIKKLNDNIELSLKDAINFVAAFFNLQDDNFENGFFNLESAEDWKILSKYDRRKEKENFSQTVELKTLNKDLLKYMPTPHILSWEQEGISSEVMLNRGICYNPISQAILIPHYDIKGNLIGIRERTLVEENEVYGKYHPAILKTVMYNHPLGFNLYNLNNSKDAISSIKKAIVWEGEKSCLLYASYFGEENDITCAVCGSSLTNYQVQLLLSLGVEEIIIGFDKQFQTEGDEEWKRWTKKLTDIHTQYGKLCQISFLFDKEGKFLKYKDSPIDEGKDIFLQLFKERIYL